jgi:hypothetical protein
LAGDRTVRRCRGVLDADYLSLVTVDVDPKVEDAFNRWYNDVHVGEVLDCPGWLSGARYVAVEGSPKYLALYEIEDEKAMWTPELRAIKGFGEFWGDLEAYRSTVYRRIHAQTAAERARR